MAVTVTPTVISIKPEGELTGQKLILHTALVKRNVELSKMYLGAHTVLCQSNNPERYIHAAHSLREIIEKLPLYLEISKKKKGASLKDKCINLVACWNSKALKSSANNDGEFQGEIDNKLCSFMREFAKFIEWFKNDNPSRKDEKRKLLRELDGYGIPMPNEIEKNRVNQLDAYQGYFTGVSHHNKSVVSEEFDSYLYHFELFLLDIFVPRTFEKHEEIDDLIVLGEADD